MALGNTGDERLDRLGTGSIGKLLFEFSIPAIVSLVLEMLYSVVDSAFVGWGVGSLGLAATTVAFPAFMLMMASIC